MQRGTIVERRNSWTLVYHDIQVRNGKRKRVVVSKKLARIGAEYPTKKSVRTLADDILAPVNQKVLIPESSLKLTEFIEDFYFPGVAAELRPSTLKAYKTAIYEPHLKPRLKKLGLRVRDFRTVHAQRLLRDIEGLSHRTLQHVRSFLSGVFKYAKREGVIDGVNPLQDVKVPGRPSNFKGRAYSLAELDVMLEELGKLTDPTASQIIFLLALTGLRQGEARSLRWSDWDETNHTLNIQRSTWGKNTGPTKSASSQAMIPILRIMEEVLRSRRERVKPEPDDYIFAGKKKGPLNLHNLEERVIKPALTIPEDERVERGMDVYVQWNGYHGFRRGLATILMSLGVKPTVAAAILRNDVSVMLEYYNQTPDAETRQAMEQLESKIRARANE